MEDTQAMMRCPLCGRPASKETLAEADWLPPAVLLRLVVENPDWEPEDGACPACVQRVLLQSLLDEGDAALHTRIQTVWPLDAGAAFGALPTALRLHADPRYSGRGVTLALVDAGFYPHPDLVGGRNRVRAWVDAGTAPARAHWFTPDAPPRWPGWDDGHWSKWHGLMTSTVAAGNGRLSHGVYSGLAYEANLVLVQARDPHGHISNATIARALQWLYVNRVELNLRVVSISVAGDMVPRPADDPVDRAVAALVRDGITVVAAAGNDGQRRLVPPATAPDALTIGGLDDKNSFSRVEREIWHSNYGAGNTGLGKPEVVAPSIWVVAPVLPGSDVATNAARMFAARARGETGYDAEIAAQKLITPHYQHVEGTSFAAPIVASVVACMLEANPRLTPAEVRAILIAAAQRVPGADDERQGAGALDPGQAVALALRAQHGPLTGQALSPVVTPAGVVFLLHDRDARRAQVRGSWDNWKAPGLEATALEPGLWRAARPPLPPGTYTYQFLIDGTRWLDDPSNPHKMSDAERGLTSVLTVPARQ